MMTSVPWHLDDSRTVELDHGSRRPLHPSDRIDSHLLRGARWSLARMKRMDKIRLVRLVEFSWSGYRFDPHSSRTSRTSWRWGWEAVEPGMYVLRRNFVYRPWWVLRLFYDLSEAWPITVEDVAIGSSKPSKGAALVQRLTEGKQTLFTYVHAPAVTLGSYEAVGAFLSSFACVSYLTLTDQIVCKKVSTAVQKLALSWYKDFFEGKKP